MNDRYSADTINDDALDQLYDQLDRVRDAAALHRQGLLGTPELYAVIEATLDEPTPITDTEGRVVCTCTFDTRCGCGTSVHYQPAPGPAATQATEAVRQMDADTTDPHTGLVVQPYTVHGERKWVFRCWGTDTCDGWLSLDHYNEQSATRARDRHVAEEHAAPGPTTAEAVRHTDTDPDDPPAQCWHTEPDTPCDWNACKQPERLAAGDYGTDPREQH